MRTLKLIAPGTDIKLIVTDCPRLANCIFRGSDVELLNIDDLTSLETFELDIWNDLGFMQLDRFDMLRQFKFGADAPLL